MFCIYVQLILCYTATDKELSYGSGRECTYER